MPVLPPAPGIARVVLEMTHINQQVRNVLHFGLTDTAVTPNLPILAQKVGEWWVSQLQPIVANDTVLQAVTAASLASAGAPATIWAPPTIAQGAGGTTGMPGNVTIVMSLITALRGKSYRGRIYHVGLTEPNVSGNQVISIHVTALLAAYNGLLGLLQATGTPLRLGVLSYYANNALRPAPVFTPVTTIKCDGTVDSQRRRLAGRGR